MDHRFVQLSDPHLTSLQSVRARQLLSKRALGYLSWRRQRRDEHRPEVLQALQADLGDYSLQQILVTGDLTHIGLPEEFVQAANWLQAMGEPEQIAVVPGNHDACVAVTWSRGLGLWQDYLASDNELPSSRRDRNPYRKSFPSMRVRGDVAYIGLSSACPTPPLMATGTLGRQQLESLATLLDSAAAQGLFRVVFLHHCPLPGIEKWRKRLTDARALQKVLQRHGAELVLHGHGHRSHHHELKADCGEIPVIAVPSASAMGLHGADVAQYNHYLVRRNASGWELEITERRYDLESHLFQLGHCREVHLPRAR